MDIHRNNRAEFEDFLKRHRLVTPEKAGFYVYWVDRFLKYMQNRSSKPVAQIVSSYLEAMETNPALPTGKSTRRRTRFFYMPINISSRNLLSFRQMAPLNQSPWDRITDETRLTGKKYSTNCTKACVFDIIRPGRKNPTGSGSTNSGNISAIANL